MKKKMKNLTPHAITVGKETIPSHGIARVSASYVKAGNVGGMEVYRQTFGDVEGLPAPESGTIYIVSALVLSALAGSRNDVFAPATGHPGVVRNEAGHIVSVPGLIGGVK